MDCNCCCCTETCGHPEQAGYTVEKDWEDHLQYIETKEEWNLALAKYTPEQRAAVEEFAAGKVKF